MTSDNAKATDERIREIAEGIHNDKLTRTDVADMDDIAKEAMAEAMARAKCYGIEDEDEAMEEWLRENGFKPVPAEDEAMDLLEATDQLTNAMYKRASEFPIASREDAIDALTDAAESAAALVGTILAIADNVDEKAGGVLLKSSKVAGNAAMQTLRAIGYLNKCNAEKDTATGGEDLSGIPYVEVGYADGSKARLTGHFGMDTMADVARLMAYRNADEAEEA